MPSLARLKFRAARVLARRPGLYALVSRFLYAHPAVALLGRGPYFGHQLLADQMSEERALAMVALLRKACQGRSDVAVLEIGSWAGQSAVLWASAMKRMAVPSGSVFCVDPWAHYATLETNPFTAVMSWAARHDRIFPLFLRNIQRAGQADVVVPIRAASRVILPRLASASLDLVYIDGDHALSAVSLDVRESKRLVRDGGYLCGDDLELQLGDVDQEFARHNAEIDFVVDPKTGVEFHPGVTVGVGDAFGGEVATYKGFWAMQRAGERWVKVDLTP